jgi:hypothetical protein
MPDMMTPEQRKRFVQSLRGTPGPAAQMSSFGMASPMIYGDPTPQAKDKLKEAMGRRKSALDELRAKRGPAALIANFPQLGPGYGGM